MNILEILKKHRRWLDGNDGGERADLTGANLTGANLRNAYLTGANLTDANLRDANLRGTDLIGADLTGANLRDANLRDAKLRGADLTCTRGGIDGGQDHRGYRFVAVRWQDGWHVFAGCCHWASFDQALEYYKGANGLRGVECPVRIALLKTVAESLA